MQQVVSTLTFHPSSPQFIVHEVPGQELEVELYDKDPDQDDFLGRWEARFCLGEWGLLEAGCQKFVVFLLMLKGFFGANK